MAPANAAKWLACAHCEAGIADTDDLMSYRQSADNLHLSVKPERASDLVSSSGSLTRKPQEGKKRRVACGACAANLGSELALGPNRADFVALSMEDVVIGGGRRFAPKDRWRDQHDLRRLVEARDEGTFLGGDAASTKPKEPVRIPVPATPIKLPTETDVNCFRWDDILVRKVPRDYQLEAFVECLLRDTLLVRNLSCIY
jgi:hypothetical protein